MNETLNTIKLVYGVFYFFAFI